jgi:polyisoprenoid-binding protein YceI
MTKRPIVCSVLLLASAGLFAKAPELDPHLTYNVNKAQSRLEFFVKATFAKVNAVFPSYEVEFQAPTPRFENASLSIAADAASVTTGSSDRDKLIKGNPQKFTMEGDFTLRGVTKPVKVQLTVQPYDSRNLELEGEFAINRRDFGMTYKMGLNKISETIRLRFDLYLQGTTGGVPIT